MSTSTGQLSERRPARARLTSVDVFCLVLMLAVIARFIFSEQLSTHAVSAWSTVFAAICIQASPFVALGVLVSTSIAVLVPEAFFARVLPPGSSLAVPVAGLSGVLLPGCECGSVPVAAALIRRGVDSAPAVTFLLSAPAINPVVLIATAVAFPGHPIMVLARFAASLVAATLIGWLWQRVGRSIAPPKRLGFGEHDSTWTQIRLTASHDLTLSIGLLALGAASAATLKVTVPVGWLEQLGRNEALGILVLGLLAVLLAVCSEADAFVAASLTQFSLTAKLVFMVVGPAVDVKLIAMQIGTFSAAFARRFAPLTFVVTLGTATAVATVLL